ncbi:MAG: hypothetical protein RL685_6348 [Pseudomonadota bacterium]|jgi:hypothetical protein
MALRQPQADFLSLRSGAVVALGAAFLGFLGCGDASALKSNAAAQGGEQGNPIDLGSAGAGSTAGAAPRVQDPGPPTTQPPLPTDSTLPASLTAEYAQSRPELAPLIADVSRLRQLNAEQLLTEFPVAAARPLGYSPGSAEFLDRIQDSALALNDAELTVLESNGFAISSRRQFPSFLRGYAAIYMEHLPVYVSADAILDALHRSYDDILATLESSMTSELWTLLEQWRTRVDTVRTSDQAKQDLALYLDVARELLGSADGGRVSKITSSAQARQLAQRARDAQGIAQLPLFGTERLLDFSQFEPRGHYVDGLQNYFRAMMWLGRVDFRLLETQTDGSVLFRRSQYEAALALHQLQDEATKQLWSHIDDTVRAFVGESDYMTVPQLAQLVDDLGGLEGALNASDLAVATAIRDGGYGAQQIASHLMVNDGNVATLPLNRSFALFGQRYVADSHVFSEVVYDRIAGRMMPNPLDAAFAALGNNQALRLSTDLRAYPQLPGALGGMRHLIDEHPESFWQANLYNLWSSALRALSPVSAGAADTGGLPSVTGTEAWGRRLLNTQLGSWAQLRHDTVLYAKQSYSGIPGCDFPDAYIEPYPDFFAALVRYAERGALLAALSGSEPLQQLITDYFSNLRSTAARLEQMAEQQRTGTPHTAEQLAFINDAVRVLQSEGGCVVTEYADGWYSDLFFQPDSSLARDPTITDVHTQPADATGNIVGRVLHVGTGLPRLMAVTVDTCSGPRAYVGLAYAYHEQVTEQFERLTDEVWNERLDSAVPPAEVPWMQDLIAP